MRHATIHLMRHARQFAPVRAIAYELRLQMVTLYAIYAAAPLCYVDTRDAAIDYLPLPPALLSRFSAYFDTHDIMPWFFFFATCLTR